MGGQGGRARSRRDPRRKRHRAGRDERSRGAARLGRAAQRRHPCRPSRRHRARAGLPARSALRPHQRRERGGACISRARQCRAVGLPVLGAGAKRAFGRAPDHRDGRARPDRRLWPLEARRRAAARTERRPLHRAPSRRGLRQRREGQYRRARDAGADAHAASLRGVGQSPLAASRATISSRRSRLRSARARL